MDISAKVTKLEGREPLMGYHAFRAVLFRH